MVLGNSFPKKSGLLHRPVSNFFNSCTIASTDHRDHATAWHFPRNVFIAWAAQVSLPQLAARLIAYTDARASVNIFRLIALKSHIKALRGLPNEVFAMIASGLWQVVFKREIVTWIRRSECLNGSCSMPYLYRLNIEFMNDYDGHLEDISIGVES